jgi:hypothetical protein
VDGSASRPAPRLPPSSRRGTRSYAYFCQSLRSRDRRILIWRRTKRIFAGISLCAGGGTRTHTTLRSPEFESSPVGPSRPDVSGNLAYLCGFQPIHEVAASSAYWPVPVWLQYSCSNSPASKNVPRHYLLEPRVHFSRLEDKGRWVYALKGMFSRAPARSRTPPGSRRVGPCCSGPSVFPGSRFSQRLQLSPGRK